MTKPNPKKVDLRRRVTRPLSELERVEIHGTPAEKQALIEQTGRAEQTLRQLSEDERGATAESESYKRVAARLGLRPLPAGAVTLPERPKVPFTVEGLVQAVEIMSRELDVKRVFAFREVLGCLYRAVEHRCRASQAKNSAERYGVDSNAPDFTPTREEELAVRQFAVAEETAKKL